MQPDKRATDGCDTIHSIIKTLSDLYEVVQLDDANQETHKGVVEEEISEVGLRSAKSAPPLYHLDPVSLIFKIQAALGQLKGNLKDVKRLQLDVKTELDEQLCSLRAVVEDADPTKIENELEGITKKLLDLMRKVSVLPNRKKKKRASADDWNGILCLPAIHANEEDLKRLAVFRHVQDEFDKLSGTPHLQICLLSFGVFPENQEVNRTMLMYWWIGEGILPDEFIPPEESILPGTVKPKKGVQLDKGKPEKDRPEDVVKAILEDFMKKKLIEAVENKRKVKPNSYKMSPFVHSSVVLISQEIGLFDMYHKGKMPSMNKSELKKVCLVEGSSSQQEAKTKIMEPADIETVFNVSEMYPDFIFRWFSSMKRLRVLYLGRWERTEREIEVDSYGVMKDLSSMGNLTFLSFQGISTIRTLIPSACKLPRLIILDLRGCYNLEQLPQEIDDLKNLLYLDMTGCDALESIPKRLSWLNYLEVLKGFVVADDREIACQLNELKHLKKLRKLSLTVDRKGYGLDDLLKDLKYFENLEMLKARWRSVKPKSKKQRDNDTLKNSGNTTVTRLLRAVTFQTDTYNRSEREVYLPKRLKKLDLRRFPDSKLPKWLQPQKLTQLEKLHLGSSRHLKVFSDALPKMPSECNVKVLRLKCLQKLKVDWIELRELFPNLIFLEMYECPRVTFCPCDRDGIWRAVEANSTAL